ncbi:hypothetical protein N9901_02760 [Flavobacteriaceae bacterium]|nr:hypothetical protein [Flavobacteriaceae bacterium]
MGQNTVSTVVDAYFSAIGGKSRVGQVESLYIITKTNYNSRELVIHSKQKKENKKSISIFRDSVFVSKKVFANNEGFVQLGEVKKKYTKGQMYALMSNVAIFPEYYYLDKAVYLGIVKVLDEKCHVLGLGDKRIYYSVASGLKIKAGTTKNLSGKRFKQETYYLDYKEVFGIKFPIVYKTITSSVEMLYNVISISINRDVSDADFE